METDLAEIQLGQLALQKSTNPKVRQFAQKMVDDHSKANDQLRQVASANGLTVPEDLDRKTRDEASLRDWVLNDPARRAEYGDPWSAITVAEQKYHAIALRYRLLVAGRREHHRRRNTRRRRRSGTES